MKVALLCLVLVAVHHSDAAIKCIQGDGKDKTAKVCAGADAEQTKCSGPKFVEFTGLSAGTYACGACKAGKGTTCDECDGNTETACNAAKETGADFKCHNYEVEEGKDSWAKTGTATTCQRLKATPIKCNWPTATADKTYKMQNKGCGGCDATALKEKKCQECTTAECNIKAAAIKCIQGDGKDMTAKDCATEDGKAAPTKCHQAKFVEFTGLVAGQTYGCGACPAESSAKCQDCTGSATAACNKKIETDADFKCYDYELKEDKLVQKKDAVTCKRLKNTAIKCNKPGTKADKTYKVQKNGCGPCTDADKKANKCAECDKAECNTSSAYTVTALLLPLIATLYTLL